MNDLSDWLSPVERAYHELAQFFARVPLDEKNAERVDRRVFRWVLCGEHGFRRAAKEQCPTCGGHAEPRLNREMHWKLKQQHTKAKAAMKAAARAHLTTEAT